MGDENNIPEDQGETNIVSFVQALTYLAMEAQRSGSDELAERIEDALTTALRQARNDIRMAS